MSWWSRLLGRGRAPSPADEPGGPGYDLAADVGLAPGRDVEATGAPGAGELVPPDDSPGYDAARDTGL